MGLNDDIAMDVEKSTTTKLLILTAEMEKGCRNSSSNVIGIEQLLE